MTPGLAAAAAASAGAAAAAPAGLRRQCSSPCRLATTTLQHPPWGALWGVGTWQGPLLHTQGSRSNGQVMRHPLQQQGGSPTRGPAPRACPPCTHPRRRHPQQQQQVAACSVPHWGLPCTLQAPPWGRTGGLPLWGPTCTPCRRRPLPQRHLQQTNVGLRPTPCRPHPTTTVGTLTSARHPRRPHRRHVWRRGCLQQQQAARGQRELAWQQQQQEEGSLCRACRERRQAGVVGGPPSGRAPSTWPGQAAPAAMAAGQPTLQGAHTPATTAPQGTPRQHPP